MYYIYIPLRLQKTGSSSLVPTSFRRDPTPATSFAPIAPVIEESSTLSFGGLSLYGYNNKLLVRYIERKKEIIITYNTWYIWCASPACIESWLFLISSRSNISLSLVMGRYASTYTVYMYMLLYIQFILYYTHRNIYVYQYINVYAWYYDFELFMYIRFTYIYIYTKTKHVYIIHIIYKYLV